MHTQPYVLKTLVVLSVISLLGFALLACDTCKDATANINDCRKCWGIEDLGNGTISTPCKSFRFEQNKVCECDRF